MAVGNWILGGGARSLMVGALEVSQKIKSTVFYLRSNNFQDRQIQLKSSALSQRMYGNTSVGTFLDI
jgi:hypothetical protein